MSIPLISKIKPQNNGAFPMYDDVDGYGGFQSRANNTDRDNIPTLNRKEGMLVYTIDNATYWTLGPGLTNSDWEIASIGSGGLSPSDLAQTTWYFDSVSGDDTNTGLIGSPLKTTAEYIKRVGFTRSIAVGQTVDLYFLNDMVSTDRLSMKVVMGDPTSNFRIHGTATPMLSDNITNYVALDVTTNTQPAITASGIGASHIGKTIYFPNIDGYAVIWKDLGSNQVYIDEPKHFSNATGAYSTMTVVPPSSTEAFIVYDMTKLYLGSIDFVCGYQNIQANAWPPRFLMENFNSIDSFTLNGSGGFYQFTCIRNAQIRDVVTLGNSSNYFRTCYFNANFGGSTSFSAQIETGVKFTGCVLSGGNILGVATLFGLQRFDCNIINCAFIALEYSIAQEGKVGIFTTNPGAFSGIIIFQGVWDSTHNTDVMYGNVVGDTALMVCRDSQFIYQPGFQMYTTTASGRQIAVRGVGAPNLSPSLMLSTDSLLPTSAPCTTWAQVLAAPFNGTAWDYSTQSGFTTDPFNTSAPSGTPPTASTMGGDTSGTFPNPSVIKIQGNAIKPDSLGALQDGYALTWVNADGYWEAKPSTSGGGAPSGPAGGDLSSTYPNPIVANINGTTITTAGGSLTTGNVLRVTGASTVDYGAVDLANSSAVTGTLPIVNLASGTAGQFLIENSGATAPSWVSISNDISASTSTVGALTVNSITGGVSSVLTVSNPIALTTGVVATNGNIRGPNATTIISVRDSGNTKNISLIGSTSGGNVVIGDGTNATNINLSVPSANLIQFQAAGNNAIVYTLRDAGITTQQFAANVTAANINQEDLAINNLTAATMTIQAQNETGTTSTGGTLVLTAGTGTTKYGDVKIVGPLAIGKFTQAMADAPQTISTANSINNILVVTGTNTAVRALTISCAPTAGTVKIIDNQTATNGITAQFISGSATGTIAPGTNAIVYGDGTNAQLLRLGTSGSTSYGTYASRPGSASSGNVYYPSDGHNSYVWTGSAWAPLILGSMVGTQPPSAATFSGVNTGASALADLNGALEITGVSDGSSVIFRGYTMAITPNSTNSVEGLIYHQVLAPPSGALSSTFSVIGICFRESSSGKIASINLTVDFTSVPFKTSIEYQVWTNSTTRTVSNTFFTPGTDTNAFTFLRIRLSGASIIAEYSKNRISWNTIDSRNINTVFTTVPNEAGLGTMGFNNVPHGYALHFSTT